MDEMAKWMGARTQAEGRVILGIVNIQCFKALVWWVADQKKCCLLLEATNFTAEVMEQASTERILHEELAAKEPLMTYMLLGKFDPDDFDSR